jgi:hypothetical protein
MQPSLAATSRTRQICRIQAYEFYQWEMKKQNEHFLLRAIRSPESQFPLAVLTVNGSVLFNARPAISMCGDCVIALSV